MKFVCPIKNNGIIYGFINNFVSWAIAVVRDKITAQITKFSTLEFKIKFTSIF